MIGNWLPGKPRGAGTFASATRRLMQFEAMIAMESATMMRIYRIVAPLALVALLGCKTSQRTVTPGDDPPDKAVSAPSWVDPSTIETLETTYPDGAPKWHRQVLAGKRDEAGDYIDHGFSTHWYQEGIKRAEVSFSRGQLHGESRTWREDGTLWSVQAYEFGVEQGMWTNYHANGQKYDELTYVGGQREGMHTVWYADGTKQQESHWRNGLLHGAWATWYPDGKNKEAGQYVDGQQDGSWTKWATDGTVLEQMSHDVGETAP